MFTDGSAQKPAGAGSSYKLSFDKKAKVYVGYFSPDQNKPETYSVIKNTMTVSHWMNGGDWKAYPPSHTATGTREELK